MRVEKFPYPMHPEQKHVYTFSFTKNLAEIGDGSDTIVAAPAPTVIVTSPTTPPGFVITGVGLDTSNTKIVFTADVLLANEEDAAYNEPGVTICLQANGVSSSGDDLVQQAELTITDQC